MRRDFQRFFEESCLEDSVYDLVIQVGSREYAVHKYVIASHSDYLRKRIMDLNLPLSEKVKLTLENIVPEAFEQILQFLYTNFCDFFVEGKKIVWLNEKSKEMQENNEEVRKNNLKKSKGKKHAIDERSDPLKCMKQACKLLNLKSLAKKLEEVQLLNGQVHIAHKIEFARLMFNNTKLSCLYDVQLRSSDHVEFPCHKCVLIARSDYFHSMLGSSFWIEKTSLEPLTLPVHSHVLKLLINYFYSDADVVSDIEDPELLCQVLVAADLLLIVRLKEMCEMALVSLLTLKNASEILQLAHIYNANQLKISCLEFICINLPSILEARNLDALGDEMMKELTVTYRNMVPNMQHRVITPSPEAPLKRDLEDIARYFPVNEDSDFIHKMESKLNEQKVKSRRRVKSQGLEVSVGEVSSHSCNSESCGKDITLEVVAVQTPSPKKAEIAKAEKYNHVPENKAAVTKLEQQTLRCIKPIDSLSLNQIMEEERKLTVLKKSSNFSTELKRFPHLSQKQKKQLAASNAATNVDLNKNVPKSPPCPWAKVNENLSTPCAWKSPTRKDSHQSDCTSPDLSTWNFFGSSPPTSKEPLTISLREIQKTEEEEVQFMLLKPKIKPLHIINIEDQAIEELLTLYKAEGNPDEKITVSRVLPLQTARPVWKKHSGMPLLSPSRNIIR